MPMPVKLDEALSGSVAEPLKSRGYLVRTVREQGWAGLKDPVPWPLLQAEHMFFITADKGFGNVKKYPPGTHAGTLLLRPGRESILEYKSLIQLVLNRYLLEDLLGTVSVATPSQIRIRRAH